MQINIVQENALSVINKDMPGNNKKARFLEREVT